MPAKLVLNINPKFEEELVDALLSMDAVSGFTSMPVSGSGSHRHMSLAEQVTGRRKRVQFELLLDDAHVGDVLAQLRQQLGGNIFYRVEPVARFGKLEDL